MKKTSKAATKADPKAKITKDVSPKAMGEETVKTAKGGPSVEVQISRMLVRAIWKQEWVAANPAATAAQRKRAWELASATQFEKSTNTYRRALSAMKRLGVVISMSPTAEAEDGPGEEA